MRDVAVPVSQSGERGRAAPLERLVGVSAAVDVVCVFVGELVVDDAAEGRRGAHAEGSRSSCKVEGVPWHGPEDDLPLRLRILVNLGLEQWRSMHNFGLMDDSEIRRLVSGLFAGEAGRRRWAECDDGYRADRRNVRTRAFPG
ncbi:hypothetical protein ACWEJ6_05420 [Nonomuraea sp. NPDC004702]